jgi:TldD protein
VDNVSVNKFSGGLVRTCINGGWAACIFDSLENVDNYVKEACENARAAGKEKTNLAKVDSIEREITVDFINDFRGVTLEEKIDLTKRYNNILLKYNPAIVTTVVVYAESFRTVHFASSGGTYYKEERPIAKLYLSATARDGHLVQTAADGIASKIDYHAITDFEEKIPQIAERAVRLLKAPSCKGGKYTVVLDQKLAGGFAHEAFGHLSEADFLYENPKMLKMMPIGREMGVKQLNIVDDGSLDSLIGTYALDDEGTPTQKTYLIKEGILRGHLHSLETAAKMGAKPTGNARAINRKFAPIVRMTNTYIEKGDNSFDEIISDIDKGIYACGMTGGMTELEMFTFTAQYGYFIENGRVGELIRDITLSGNVFSTLYSIDRFGNDLVIYQQPGGCGKNGQYPLPVTFGAPHIRIQDVTVGGKEG